MSFEPLQFSDHGSSHVLGSFQFRLHRNDLLQGVKSGVFHMEHVAAWFASKGFSIICIKVRLDNKTILFEPDISSGHGYALLIHDQHDQIAVT